MLIFYENIDDIEQIRSVGRAGFGDDVITRAVQVVNLVS